MTKEQEQYIASVLEKFDKKLGISDSNGDLFIQAPNSEETAKDILKSFLTQTLRDVFECLPEKKEKVDYQRAYGRAERESFNEAISTFNHNLSKLIK